VTPNDARVGRELRCEAWLLESEQTRRPIPTRELDIWSRRDPAQIEPRGRTPSAERTVTETAIAHADEQPLDPYLTGGEFPCAGWHPASTQRLVERLALAGARAELYTCSHPASRPYTRMVVHVAPDLTGLGEGLRAIGQGWAS